MRNTQKKKSVINAKVILVYSKSWPPVRFHFPSWKFRRVRAAPIGKIVKFLMQRRIGPSPSPLWLNGLENYYDEISAGPTLSCNRAGVNHPSTSFSTFQRGCSRSAGVRSFTQLLTTRVKLPRGSKGAMKLWRFSLPATLCRKSWKLFYSLDREGLRDFLFN